MIECSRCNNNCANARYLGESINTAEFCAFIVDKLRKMAKTYICNEKIPSEHIERHLATIANAHDFWHPEDLFDEGDRGEDGEDMSEDEAEFWTIFDGMVDELFEE